MVVVDRAAEHVRRQQNRFVLQFPERLTPQRSHVTIPVDGMPALGVYSTSCTMRPVMGVGRAETNDIRGVGVGVIVWRLAQDANER